MALEFPRTDRFSGRAPGLGSVVLAMVLAMQAIVFVRGAAAAEPNADALIAQGLELRRQGQAAEALPLFQKAHTLEPTPRTRGQLGLVETSLQHWMDADTHLTAALESPAEPWVSSNRKLLDKALSVARQHIGELVIDGPAGAHVFVSGRGSRTLPLTTPIRVGEGEVRVSAIAAGFKQQIQVVRIEGGKRASVALKLVPYPVVSAPPPAPHPTSDD